MKKQKGNFRLNYGSHAHSCTSLNHFLPLSSSSGISVSLKNSKVLLSSNFTHEVLWLFQFGNRASCCSLKQKSKWLFQEIIPQRYQTITNLFFILSEKSTIVTLYILREQGFVGDIHVQLIPKPVFSLPFANQAIENEDYRLENKTVIMTENMTTVSVTVAILPVSV